MSTTTLYRLSGLALMAALPLWLVGEFFHPPTEDVRYLVLPTYPLAHILDLAGFLFVVLAMPAFYARQAARAGRLGFVGFVITMLFLLGTCELLMWETFGAPRLASTSETSYLVIPTMPGSLAGGATSMMANGALGVVGRFYVLGVLTLLAPIVFGIATWRARVYPRSVGILQIAALAMIPVGGLIQTGLSKFGFFNADLSVIGLSYGTLLLAYAWGGYVLWRERQPLMRAPRGTTEDRESVSKPLEVTAVARIRGTQGIQEDTKGHDEPGD
jgi:hypothetical protein